MPDDVKEAAKALTPAMVNVLAEVALDPDAPPAARVTAATAVLDRAWGKPTANVDARVATVDMTAMHLEALKALSNP